MTDFFDGDEELTFEFLDTTTEREEESTRAGSTFPVDHVRRAGERRTRVVSQGVKPADISGVFEDLEFFGDRALGQLSVSGHRYPIQWRRITELHEHASLFGTIQSDNIRQGELGNCWLLASIAVLADFPGHVMNLFDEITLNPQGRYVVNLHDIQKGWQKVEIDDRIPCDCRGRPLFAQLVGTSGAMWALLLEKAVAKFAGTYARLDGGSACWGFQAMTGQAVQANWSRENGKWTRFEQGNLEKYQATEEGRLDWRRQGMRRVTWRGPVETCNDEEMFSTLAAYTQASYFVCCAMDGGREIERSDGLLTGHEYSVLQVTQVHGKRLVELRNPWGAGGEWNGAWGDGTQEWRRYPQVAEDLNPSKDDDGVFFMPWDAFIHLFGGNVAVCPVTLPCPPNSSLKKTGTRSCPACHQLHSRSWVYLTNRSWYRLGEEDICFLCLRATGRATNPTIRLLGVHEQPVLTTAPPPMPRQIKDLCKFGARCYRRNPQHFHDSFHIHLLPTAPPCVEGCGRTAASGYISCCATCSAHKADLEVITDDQAAAGVYKAVPDRMSHDKPVYKKDGADMWLWFGSAWMFGRAKGVGGNSGSIAGSWDKAPHLVKQWQQARPEGWVDMKLTVKVISDPAAHNNRCNQRLHRENYLNQHADHVLGSRRTTRRMTTAQ